MIDDNDISRLKEIFVTRQECNTQNDEINAKLSNDWTELAVIKSKLNTITWLLSTIGAGVSAALVKLYFGA